jgi:CHAD domain-containing protein
MPQDTAGDGLRYDVGLGVELLGFGGVLAEESGVPPLVMTQDRSDRLEATYFDTADRRLSRAGLTVHRRTGGDAAGWVVEIPGADGGASVRLPAGRSAVTVPAAIRKLVWASTRGADLHPLARVVTEGTTLDLVDTGGNPVVTITDERVTGSRLTAVADAQTAEPPATTWRVVSIATDVAAWRDAIAAALHRSGATTADDRSDLARVLADTDASHPLSEPDPQPFFGPASPDSSAGVVVLRYVGQQLEQILGNDPRVRVDGAGSVHRMRVASRRLRSALDTFRPVLNSGAVKPLRTELKWLAGELGAARDAEVMRDRMGSALRAEDRQVHVGPLGDAVDTEMDQVYRTAHAGLLRALDSARYHRLVLALHDLCVHPPMTAKADRPARRVLPRRAARAYRRLKALVEAAAEASTSAERDVRLHEARKAAKKARYAAEALTEFFGNPAARFAAAMEILQEELGEHQDSVVLRARVEELAQQTTSTATAFAYGRLHAHEEQRGDVAVERFEAAWNQARKKSLRAWFG